MLILPMLVSHLRPGSLVLVGGVLYEIATVPTKDPIGEFVLNFRQPPNNRSRLTIHVPHYVAMEVHIPLM